MATLDADGWELESAEERHAIAPHSFRIPDREERESLRVGERVQLLFLLQVPDVDPPDVMCERMWVTIDDMDASEYFGTLDSMPATSDVLAPGDTVRFGPHHVATVLIPKTDPRHPEYKRGA